MNNALKDSSQPNDDEIDLKELFKVLFDGKWLLIAITSFFSVTAVLYSLSLPNIYQSTAILSPVGVDSNMNQALRNYGGLASLAGVNLASSSNMSNAEKALEKLNSLSFFTDSILPNIYLPDLMAVDSWDPINNTINYKEDLFNEQTQSWVRDFQYPKTQIPSAQESFKIFKNIMEVEEHKAGGFYVITVKHQSPYIAQAWTQLIVSEINNFFRTKDRIESETAISFLNTQIAQTSLSEIKEVIAQLLKQNTQRLALIEVSDFYVYEYIDHPAVMEEKSEPSRATICILAAIFGGLFGVIVVLARYFYKNLSNSNH